MKSLTSNIIGLATVCSFLLPIAASAKSPVGVMRNGVLTPSGFCTVADDNSVGVRFDNMSYDMFWELYAMPEQSAKTLAQNLFPYETELFKAQQAAEFRKAAAHFQRTNVRRAQESLCK